MMKVKAGKFWKDPVTNLGRAGKSTVKSVDKRKRIDVWIK